MFRFDDEEAVETGDVKEGETETTASNGGLNR